MRKFIKRIDDVIRCLLCKNNLKCKIRFRTNRQKEYETRGSRVTILCPKLMLKRIKQMEKSR